MQFLVKRPYEEEYGFVFSPIVTDPTADHDKNLLELLKAKGFDTSRVRILSPILEPALYERAMVNTLDMAASVGAIAVIENTEKQLIKAVLDGKTVVRAVRVVMIEAVEWSRMQAKGGAGESKPS